MPEPLHRWVPAYSETDGDLAGRMGERVAMPMDPEQQDILDAVYAEQSPGRPVCREVAIVGPRQNLKTATLEVAALTDLYTFRVPLHVWTAHLFDTARKSFEHMVGLIESVPDMKRRTKVTTANGNESIELRDGGERIEFHAREKTGGRGISGDRITFDEALILSGAVIGALMPTLATRSGWQVRYASSAGLLQSSVLRRLRDRGRAGGARRLAYWEFGAPVTSCLSLDCPHIPPGQTGHVPGCALDREDLWAMSNPALGRRIELETLRDFRQSMPPEEFQREFLTWWEDPVSDDDERAITDDVWVRQRDPESLALDPVSIGIEVSPARDASIVAAGWRSDGRIHGEEIASGKGTGWVLPVLLSVVDRVDPMALVIDRAGPAGSLLPDIEAAGLEVLVLTSAQRAAADLGLADDLEQNRTRVRPSPGMDAAVRQATWRDLPSGKLFDRRGGKGNIAALVGLSEARFGLLTAPKPTPPARMPEPLPGGSATRSSGELDLLTVGF